MQNDIKLVRLHGSVHKALTKYKAQFGAKSYNIAIKSLLKVSRASLKPRARKAV